MVANRPAVPLLVSAQFYSKRENCLRMPLISNLALLGMCVYVTLCVCVCVCVCARMCVCVNTVVMFSVYVTLCACV